MNSSEIEHKIRKYTVKLQGATNTESTEVYQRKLDYYHKLVQDGGDYFNDLQDKIKQGKANILEIKEKLDSGKVNISAITDLKQKVDKASTQYNTMISANLKAGQAVSQMNSQIRELSESSSGFEQRANEAINAETDAIGTSIANLEMNEEVLMKALVISSMGDDMIVAARKKQAESLDAKDVNVVDLRAKVNEQLSMLKDAKNSVYAAFIIDSFNGNLDELKALIETPSKKVLLTKANAFLNEISDKLIPVINSIVPEQGIKAAFTFQASPPGITVTHAAMSQTLPPQSQSQQQPQSPPPQSPQPKSPQL